MMNLRHPFIKLAALGALVSALPLLMAPSGGYPTRPTFQQVTVNGTGVDTFVTLHGAAGQTSDFAANVALGQTVCFVNNGSAAASDCGMPAGGLGIASTAGIFLHSTNGLLTSDATQVSMGNTTLATLSAFDAHTKTGGDSLIVADVNGSGDVCLDGNASAGASGCGMPAGQFGVATVGVNLFMHSGGGGIATDATSTPWPRTFGQIIESATTCALQGTNSNLVSCARTGVGTVTITAGAGWSINNACAYGDVSSSAFHFVHTVGTLSNGVQIAVASTAGAAVDVWSLYVSCS